MVILSHKKKACVSPDTLAKAISSRMHPVFPSMSAQRAHATAGRLNPMGTLIKKVHHKPGREIPTAKTQANHLIWITDCLLSSEWLHRQFL
jgi:hypothetical protein